MPRAFLPLFIVALALFPVTCWCGSPPDLNLLEAETLKADPGAWIVLDARPGSAWEAGHIPGAASFSWEDYTRADSKGVPYRVLPPREMAAALGALGIDERSAVAVYGDAGESWGGEGWVCWVLSWLGHKGPIRLVAGGIQGWRARGFPLTPGREPVSRTPVQYQVELRPEVNILWSDLVEERTSAVIVDTRSTREWFFGHIPLAKHISWQDFYAGEDRRPIGAEALKRLLRDHGVDTSKPVVYYCTGGVRSAYAWMAHQLSGLPPARNFEGGMEEWKARYFTYRPVQEDDDPAYRPQSPK